MSHYLSTILPDGLKRQETERQSLRFSPPIPFAPVIPTEEVTEHEHEIKVKINKKISETAAVFHGGIPESYVIYLDNCAALIRKKDLATQYKGWKAELDSASEDLELHLLERPKADSDESSDSEKEAKNKKLKASLSKWTAKQLTLTDKRNNAEKCMKSTMQEVFSLYELLLSEGLRKNWIHCVTQACCEAWTDEEGNEHEKPRGYTWDSLAVAARNWLLCVFPQNAAELQRHYMYFYVIRSSRVSIINFFTRMDQLSSYIPFLPCQKDDPTISTSLTERMNKAFNQCELAGIILNCFPRRYEDQYYLNSGTVPSDLTLLRNKLIQIERVVDSSSKRAVTTSSNSGVKNEKATSSTKRAAAQSNPQDTKKQRQNGGNTTKKYCQLCAEHGGAERTHNTKDCRKYDKEGNLNKSFRSKSKKNDYERKDPKRNSYAHKSSEKRTFAAISSGLAKLEKRLKYSSRSMHGKRKGSHHYHRNDSHMEDSDMSCSSMSS